MNETDIQQPAQIPFYVHQSQMALERQHTRHWRNACLIVFITMFATLVITNVAWAVRENSFIAKDLDEVIEHREEREAEYSGNYYDGMSGRRSYGRSYARQRDSRGRYSGTYPRRSFDDRFNEMMMNDPENRGEWQR